jgi:hypothetical protein
VIVVLAHRYRGMVCATHALAARQVADGFAAGSSAQATTGWRRAR